VVLERVPTVRKRPWVLTPSSPPSTRPWNMGRGRVCVRATNLVRCVLSLRPPAGQEWRQLEEGWLDSCAAQGEVRLYALRLSMRRRRVVSCPVDRDERAVRALLSYVLAAALWAAVVVVCCVCEHHQCQAQLFCCADGERPALLMCEVRLLVSPVCRDAAALAEKIAKKNAAKEG